MKLVFTLIILLSGNFLSAQTNLWILNDSSLQKQLRGSGVKSLRDDNEIGFGETPSYSMKERTFYRNGNVHFSKNCMLDFNHDTTFVNEYEYDSLGKLMWSKIKHKEATGTSLIYEEYAYVPLSPTRMEKRILRDGKWQKEFVEEKTHFGDTLLRAITYSAGDIKFEMTYKGAGRVTIKDTWVSVRISGQTIRKNFQKNYEETDVKGRLVEKGTFSDSGRVPLNKYFYDPSGKLIKETIFEGEPYDEIYEYDSLGRMIRSVQTGEGAITTTYQYNDVGLPVKVTGKDENGVTIFETKTKYEFFE